MKGEIDPVESKSIYADMALEDMFDLVMELDDTSREDYRQYLIAVLKRQDRQAQERQAESQVSGSTRLEVAEVHAVPKGFQATEEHNAGVNTTVTTSGVAMGNKSMTLGGMSSYGGTAKRVGDDAGHHAEAKRAKLESFTTQSIFVDLVKGRNWFISVTMADNAPVNVVHPAFGKTWKNIIFPGLTVKIDQEGVYVVFAPGEAGRSEAEHEFSVRQSGSGSAEEHCLFTSEELESNKVAFARWSNRRSLGATSAINHGSPSTQTTGGLSGSESTSPVFATGISSGHGYSHGGMTSARGRGNFHSDRGRGGYSRGRGYSSRAFWEFNY